MSDMSTRKQLLARLNATMRGNFVDNNTDRCYTSDSICKVGKGLNYIAFEDGAVWTGNEEPDNPGFDIQSIGSELRLGPTASITTPIDQVAWGEEGYAVNPIMYTLPIGFPTSFPAFIPLIPQDIIMRVSLFKSVLSVLGG